MPKVDIQEVIQIGNIKKIITTTYEIPHRIFCPDDKAIMEYSSYHQRYECLKCGKSLSAIDYVESQIKRYNKEYKNNELTK